VDHRCIALFYGIIPIRLQFSGSRLVLSLKTLYIQQ
jgi:hypothetical protein